MTTRSSDTAAAPWDGQPYSVKRHGTDITNCDAEPVATPGCVQAHGVLLVLRRVDLEILQVSDNAERWLGCAAAALLGRPAAAALGERGEALLRELLRRGSTEQNPLPVFTREADGERPALDVTAHTVDGVVVVELEAIGRGDAGASPDLFLAVKQAVGRMQGSRTLRGFCQVVSDEVRALTGLDRVMVYRFHEDGHGEVFAESRRGELPAWLGLHYPAEDIPKPAREIFKQVWIRPIRNVGAALSELVPLSNPDTGKPLTMTHCALRGPSVMYTEYLQNMAVRAGLTMPIRRGNELWGLIACHHYAGPVVMPFPLRAACEVLAQVVSLQHQAVEEREQVVYRLQSDGVHQQLVAAAAREGLTTLTTGTPTLLDAMHASGAAIHHSQRWWQIGATPAVPELEALRAWLYTRPDFEGAHGPVYATDLLAREHPPAAAYAAVASGLMAVSLSEAQRSVLLWFRPETIQTVRWGGDPHDKPTVDGPHGPRLSPRRSFALFVESVRQRSLPWQPVEVEAVRRFRMLLRELVIDQSERLGELNARLTRSNEDLDAFAYVASHDLKEPLRGIHRYAHQLLADASFTTEEQRRKLDGLTRLTLRMDSLLDALLHFSRVGQAGLERDEVELAEVLGEALEMVEARRSERHTEVVVVRPLPPARCDRIGVREVFVNLLTNAMKYSDREVRRIEVGHLAAGEVGERGPAPPEAVGHTVYFVRDDGIGIHPRHHADVFKMFRRLHGRDDYGGGNGAGLSIVKKLIDRHCGQVWLESRPGAGTTVFFTLGGAAA